MSIDVCFRICIAAYQRRDYLEPDDEKRLIAEIEGLDPAVINNRNDAGDVLLHWAAYLGWQNAIEVLLDKGAQIDLPDRMMGITSLHFAAKWGILALVEFLLQAGAAVDPQCKQGHTPLYYAIAQESDKSLSVILALIQKGADIKIGNNYAALCQYLEKNRDPDAKLLQNFIKICSRPFNNKETFVENVNGIIDQCKSTAMRKCFVPLIIDFFYLSLIEVGDTINNRIELFKKVSELQLSEKEKNYIAFCLPSTLRELCKTDIPGKLDALQLDHLPINTRRELGSLNTQLHSLPRHIQEELDIAPAASTATPLFLSMLGMGLESLYPLDFKMRNIRNPG